MDCMAFVVTVTSFAESHILAVVVVVVLLVERAVAVKAHSCLNTDYVVPAAHSLQIDETVVMNSMWVFVQLEGLVAAVLAIEVAVVVVEVATVVVVIAVAGADLRLQQKFVTYLFDSIIWQQII